MCLISWSAVSSEWSNLNNVVHRMCLQLASNTASVLKHAVLFCRTSLHYDLISIYLFQFHIFYTLSSSSWAARCFSMCHTTQFDQSNAVNVWISWRAAGELQPNFDKKAIHSFVRRDFLSDHSDSWSCRRALMRSESVRSGWHHAVYPALVKWPISDNNY